MSFNQNQTLMKKFVQTQFEFMEVYQLETKENSDGDIYGVSV